MNNTKFTPGPWKWNDKELLDSTNAAIIKHEDDGACGDPECCGAGSCWVEVREADKPLIAAAPDLYAAIEAFLSYLEHDDSLHTAEAGQIDEQMHAALAKARGEK